MENRPIGIKAGELILENIYSRFERVNKIFKEIIPLENKILEFKEPIFLCLEDYSFFKENFIIVAGEEDFYFYEQEFLLKVISELRFYFFNSDVNYNIVDIGDINVIEVSVVIGERNYPIIRINPYFRFIEEVEDENINSLNLDIIQFKQNIKSLEEEEKKIELMIKKPIFGAENPLQMIDTTLRKKKNIEKLKHKLNEISNSIMDYTFKIRECETLIQEINIELAQADDEKEIIINKFVKYFNYQFLEKESSHINEIINEIDEPVKKEGLRELNKKNENSNN